jgi:hypothetical protein
LKFRLQIQNSESPKIGSLSIQPDTLNDSNNEQSNDSDDDNKLFENYAFNNCLIDQTIEEWNKHH